MSYYKSFLPFLYIIVIILGSVSCKHESKKEYTISAGQPQTSHAKVAQELIYLWGSEGLPKFRINYKSNGSVENCRLLYNKQTDFAFSQNDIDIHALQPDAKNAESVKLRTVLPVYRQVLFIIYKKDLFKDSIPISLQGLLKGKRVCIGARQSGTEKLVRALLNHFQIDSTTIHLVSAGSPQENTLSDTIDISCTVSGFNNETIAQMLLYKGGDIFSLDKVELIGRGSSVDGFCLNYQQAYPFVLPRLAFSANPHTPVLTIAVDNVLLTREETDPLLVRQMVESIYNNRQFLANANPLFSSLTETFESSSLSFPLHEGTVNYLKRNEPTLYEKYGNIFNLLLSILVPVITAISVIYTWGQRRQKTRIENYIAQVLAIDDHITSFTSIQACEEAIQKILQVRREAYQQLIDDKLSVGDNFKIFITQTDDTLDSLKEHKKMLQHKLSK